MWNPRPLPELIGDRHGWLDDWGWVVWVVLVVLVMVFGGG